MTDTNTSPATTEQVFPVDEHTSYIGVDALFEGVKAKQEYINKLQAENAQLREDNQKLTNIDTFKKELQQMMTQPSEAQQPSAATPAVMDEEKFKVIAQKLYQEQKTAEVYKANTDTVTAALTAAFGQDANNKKATKLAELGLSEEEFNAMCGKSPKVAMRLLDITEPQKPSVTTAIQQLGNAAPSPTTPPKPFANAVKEAMGKPGKMEELVALALKDQSLLAQLN